MDDIAEQHAAVEARFYVGKTLVGHDRGVLSTLYGWLAFEGERTRFSVRRVDLEGRAKSSSGSGATYELIGPGETYRVALHGLSSRRSEWVVTVPEVCADWADLRGEPGVIAVMPATTVDPEYEADVRLSATALSRVTLATLGLLFLAFCWLRGHPLAEGVAPSMIIMGFLLIFYAAALWWSWAETYKKLRRVADSEFRLESGPAADPARHSGT